MHNILIVDDEPLNIKLVEAFLEDLPYKLYPAANSTQALGILQSEVAFSLILLDRMLPEIDGIIFAQQIKSDPRFKHVPIIIQTAAAERSQIAEGFTSDIDEYLTKPFDAEDLIKKVSKCLANHAQHRS